MEDVMRTELKKTPANLEFFFRSAILNMKWKKQLCAAAAVLLAMGAAFFALSWLLLRRAMIRPAK